MWIYMKLKYDSSVAHKFSREQTTLYTSKPSISSKSIQNDYLQISIITLNIAAIMSGDTDFLQVLLQVNTYSA